MSEICSYKFRLVLIIGLMSAIASWTCFADKPVRWQSVSWHWHCHFKTEAICSRFIYTDYITRMLYKSCYQVIVASLCLPLTRSCLLMYWLH